MRRLAIPMVVAPVFMVGCAARPNKPVGTAGTLAALRNVRPDVQEVKVEQGLDQAMQQYRRFLEETPETAMTPEAMRRLADLQIEKQFGIRTGNAKSRELAAPKPAQVLASSRAGSPNPDAAAGSVRLHESDQDFERRTTAEAQILPATNAAPVAGCGAAISGGFALLVFIPNCFSSCRSARRRIASGVIAVSGVSSRKRR